MEPSGDGPFSREANAQSVGPELGLVVVFGLVEVLDAVLRCVKEEAASWAEPTALDTAAADVSARLLPPPLAPISGGFMFERCLLCMKIYPKPSKTDG